MARKHLVICAQCGRQFDANSGGYYDRQSRRYTCLRCGNAIRREYNNVRKAESAERKRALADEREQKTGMRQSTASMILKIAFGILFIYVGFTSKSTFTGLIIGVGLLAWGLVPYIKAQAKRISASKVAFPATGMDRKSKSVPAKSVPTQSVPNDYTWICRWCGATTSGNTCEFCGRVKEK